MASAHEGTARYGTAPDRVHATNPPQQPESQPREQRRMCPTSVKLAFIGSSSSCTVPTGHGTACLVEPSAFAAALVGSAAHRGPTLIPCFHSSRSGLEDNEPEVQHASSKASGGLAENLTMFSVGNILAFSPTFWRLYWAFQDRLGSPGVSFPS